MLPTVRMKPGHAVVGTAQHIVVVAWVNDGGVGHLGVVVKALLEGVVDGGAAIALRAVWKWERTRVILTTEKLFVVHGTFHRRAAAVRLSRLGAVEIEQSLVGRMLGYGTIVAGDLEIDYVPEPRRVYGLVERLSG